MRKTEDIKELEKGHLLSIKEYNNMIDSDEEKETKRKEIANESIVLDKKRESNVNRQLAIDKFNQDKKYRNKNFELELQKFNLEQAKHEFEKKRYEETKNDKKVERKFELVKTIVEVAVPAVLGFVGSMFATVLYNRQVKRAFAYSYLQDGRPIHEVPTCLKDLNSQTKSFKL